MPEEFGATLITSHNKHAVLSPINPITNKKFLLSKSIPIKITIVIRMENMDYKAAIPSNADLKVIDRLDKRAEKNIEHFINVKLSNGSIGVYDFSKK